MCIASLPVALPGISWSISPFVFLLVKKPTLLHLIRTWARWKNALKGINRDGLNRWLTTKMICCSWEILPAGFVRSGSRQPGLATRLECRTQLSGGSDKDRPHIVSCPFCWNKVNTPWIQLQWAFGKAMWRKQGQISSSQFLSHLFLLSHANGKREDWTWWWSFARATPLTQRNDIIGDHGGTGINQKVVIDRLEAVSLNNWMTFTTRPLPGTDSAAGHPQ